MLVWALTLTCNVYTNSSKERTDLHDVKIEFVPDPELRSIVTTIVATTMITNTGITATTVAVVIPNVILSD